MRVPFRFSRAIFAMGCFLWFVSMRPMWARQSVATKSAATAAAAAPAAAEPQAGGQPLAAPPQVVPALPVPRLVKFSGVVKDAAGAPRTGTVGLTFSIYQEQEGGATLWMETQNVELDGEGRYSVLLGSTQSEGMPLDLFASGDPRWLGVRVELPGEVEQARVLLVSVPYALKASDADTLGGKPASAYALATTEAGATTATASTSTAASTTSPTTTKGKKPATAGTETMGFIPMFIDTSGDLGNSLIQQSGTAIGIGESPVQTLDVNGGIRASTGLATGSRNTSADAINTNALFLNGSNAMGVIGASNAVFAPGVLFTKVSFYAGNGTATSERMTINGANGFVGINNTSPGQQLDVMGGSIRTDTQFISTVATGTAPISVTSTTMVPNLNAGLLGGIQASGFAQLGAMSNSFMGSISASGFTGSGAGLTALNPANLGAGTAAIDISGNAASASTAANALELGGMLPSAFALAGSAASPVTQTVSGALNVQGNVSMAALNGVNPTFTVTDMDGSSFSVSSSVAITTALGAGGTIFAENYPQATGGRLSIGAYSAPANGSNGNDVAIGAGNGSGVTGAGGSILIAPGTGTPNGIITVPGSIYVSSNGGVPSTLTLAPSGTAASTNFNSNALEFVTSLSNNSIERFFWQAEPTPNASGGAPGTLNLLTASADNTPAETGLSITSGGLINFASGQTFPITGTGGGTVTSIMAGSGILANGMQNGAITMAGTLAIDPAIVPLLGVQNTFTGTPSGTGVAQGSLYINPGSATPGQTLLGAAVGGTQEMLLDSSGNLTINGNLNLPATNAAGTAGVITLGAQPFAWGTPYFPGFGGGPNLGGSVYLGFAGNTASNGYANTGAGAGALGSVNTGNFNSAFGSGALAVNSGGIENSAFGAGALDLNTGGTGNSAFGYGALAAHVSNNANSAFGSLALNYDTMGGGNTALGDGALYYLGYNGGIGFNNIAVGASAGYNLSNGTNNIYIGSLGPAAEFGNESGIIRIGTAGTQTATYLAGNVTSSGTMTATSFVGNGSGLTGIVSLSGMNSFSGMQTFTAAPTGTGVGNGSVFINAPVGSNGTLLGAAVNGTQEMLLDSSGDLTLTGSLTLPNTTSPSPGVSFGVINLGTASFLHNCCGSANGNTFVGASAGNMTMDPVQAVANTAVGAGALNANTIGQDNTAVGNNALSGNSLGAFNAAFGNGALGANSSGSGNSAFGYEALKTSMTGDSNMALGEFALSSLESSTVPGSGPGSYNIAIGYIAGENLTGGNNNVYIASIGPAALGSESGIIRIGTAGTQTQTYLTGNVNIPGTLTMGGVINFSASQTFPISGTNGGTVTSITAGTGLTGGTITTSGTIGIATNACAAGNVLTGLPLTCSPVSTLGLATLGANNFTGNQTVNGNISTTTGTITSNSGFNSLSPLAFSVVGLPLIQVTGMEQSNLFVGVSAGGTGSSGSSYNTAFGNFALQHITSGTDDIAIGSGAGQNLLTSESNDIYIGNAGVEGESKTIRIGTPGVHTAAYIAGMVTTSGQQTFTAAPTGTGVGNGSVYINAPAGSNGTLLGAAVGGTQVMLVDSSGDLTLAGSLTLPTTTSATVGVINLGSMPFLHNYGTDNTFVGASAGNMTMSVLLATNNTAVGIDALNAIANGSSNAAFGASALGSHESNGLNSAFGASALVNDTTGTNNTALGANALASLGLDSGTGSNNIAIGGSAGIHVTSGNGNIYIGNAGAVSGTESNVIRIGDTSALDSCGFPCQTATYIAGISGATIGTGDGVEVFVGSAGQLGTITSSRRFKHEIADMGAQSDLLMKLRPVSFYYKPELDETQTRQYGLVAEEVAQIAPQLVVFDKDGQPETVRYHFVNAMLLNQVQKQQRALDEDRRLLEDQQHTNEEQQKTIARQQAEIESLAARLGKLEAMATGKP